MLLLLLSTIPSTLWWKTRKKYVTPRRKALTRYKCVKKGQLTEIRAAARAYDVPELTLQGRLRGRPERCNRRANNKKLSETEEESLKQWIISMNLRGAASRPSSVEVMANIL